MKADKIASRKATEAKLHLVLPPAVLGVVLNRRGGNAWGELLPEKGDWARLSMSRLH